MMTKRDMRLVQAAVLAVLTLAYIGFRSLPRDGKAAISAPAQSEFYVVSRVVDGDTLKLSNGERVRLIGVDTPEVHPSDKLTRDAKRSGMDLAGIQALGKRASDYTKSLVAGKRVRLEYDVTRRDRHGRLLAYVYLDDGTFVNAKIIEDGYGQIMTVQPNVRHVDLFLKLERDARERGRGLWAVDSGLMRKR